MEAYFTGHAFDAHRHDTYAIGLTQTGVQRFDYRGQKQDSTAGQVIVLHPDESHNGRAGADGGFRYRMLYIAPSLIRDVLGERANALPFVAAPVADNADLADALAVAFDEIDREMEGLEADQVLVSIADALLVLDPSAARTTGTSADAAGVDRARDFLDGHYDEVVASDALERVAGIDRYSLARQFRRRLGTSPYRYLTMRRLDRARADILDGVPLAEAAGAAGFADQAHMTRQFKRAYGLSPGRWRALVRARS